MPMELSQYSKITGSPAGLSRDYGDSRSCAKTWNWLRHAFQQPCQVWWRSFQRWRPHVVVKYTGRVLLIFLLFLFLYFLTSLQPIPVGHKPILTHNSSKDAGWLKEVPFKQVFFDIFTFWGVISPKYFIFHVSYFIFHIPLPVGKFHARR